MLTVPKPITFLGPPWVQVSPVQACEGAPSSLRQAPKQYRSETTTRVEMGRYWNSAKNLSEGKGEKHTKNRG